VNWVNKKQLWLEIFDPRCFHNEEGEIAIKLTYGHILAPSPVIETGLNCDARRSSAGIDLGPHNRDPMTFTTRPYQANNRVLKVAIAPSLLLKLVGLILLYMFIEFGHAWALPYSGDL